MCIQNKLTSIIQYVLGLGYLQTKARCTLYTEASTKMCHMTKTRQKRFLKLAAVIY